MSKLKIGIVREGRIPVDRRVPLLPDQCVYIQNTFHVDIVVQPSDIRCIANKEYADAGITLSEDLSCCDILMGIKEVPIHLLIPKKTYLFFSHTIKKQEHNQKLLQSIIEKKINLIDYECLVDEAGNRIVAFGRFAGIVGAYNGLLIFGKKIKRFELKRAYKCFDLNELKGQIKHIYLPNIKIAITGSGRVAKGAMEILNMCGISQVSIDDYLHKEYSFPVYAHLNSLSYNIRRDGKPGNPENFYIHPEEYESSFHSFGKVTDILIAAAYWNPKAPVLFSKGEMRTKDFRIKVIADITCDIGGSIPSTIKPCTIYDPAYDYNPYSEEIEAPYTDENNITVMAIDNLPGELPRDASEDFGNQLIKNVLPLLLDKKSSFIISNAMVTNDGKLTSRFQYLNDFIG